MELLAEIRGMGFRPPAKLLVERLPAGAKLSLVAEPSNQYDANALQVWCVPTALQAEDLAEGSEFALRLQGFGRTLEEFLEAPQWMLGYVGKEWAAQAAPSLRARGLSELEGEFAVSGAGKPQVRFKV